MPSIADIPKNHPWILVAGPPCQPFSKASHWTDTPKGLGDMRASALYQFVRILREANPTAFLLENVPGLASKPHSAALSMLLGRIHDLGYATQNAVLNAAAYGVPQMRKRLFVIGCRNGGKLGLPPATHPVSAHVTAGEAIGDLDVECEFPELTVRGKWGHLLPIIPPGDNYLFFTKKRGHPEPIFAWRSKFWSFLLKLSPDLPAWTIQAQPGPYVGPFHWRSRRLALLELMRLQTFPDRHRFAGNPNSVRRQIGNAVPPLMGRKLGASLIEACS